MELIALLDGTRYYANCATILNPELKGKAIAVTTNATRGIIIAANRDATDTLRVSKFRPIFEYKQEVESGHLTVVDANFNLFGYHSLAFHSVIKENFYDTYSYSVDEVYAKMLANSKEDALGHLKFVRRDVLKKTRVPIGCGASTTCTLAKIASHAAKKLGYKGVCVLVDETETNAVLRQIDVGDIWGVGAATAPKLRALGVRTAYDLKLCISDIKKFQKKFGRPLVATIAELNGQRQLHWHPQGNEYHKQQINSTRSITARLHNKTELHKALAYHAHQVAHSARKQKSKIKQIHFFCRTSPFDDMDKQHSRTASFRLDYPTADTTVILKMLSKCIDSMCPPDDGNGRFTKAIYKIGVGASELTNGEWQQADLFAPAENDSLMNTLDQLNNRFGKNSVYLGVKGHDFIGERLPSTTLPNRHSSWKDVPVIAC